MNCFVVSKKIVKFVRCSVGKKAVFIYELMPLAVQTRRYPKLILSGKLK